MKNPSDQTTESGPINNVPSFITLHIPDPKVPTQEVLHHVTPRETIKGPFSKISSSDVEKAPLRAARGDDDLMSQQQQQAIPSVDEIKGKWKQQIGAAKVAWGQLTDDELLKSEGHEQKLAGLVQECYAITRDEADRQVKSFFENNKS